MDDDTLIYYNEYFHRSFVLPKILQLLYYTDHIIESQLNAHAKF